MTVMCYLACLAIGALILIDRAVENWTSGLSREVTVQVRLMQDADIDKELSKAKILLETTVGVTRVEVLDRDAGAKLLEPWLGTSNLDDLPIPRLIRVTIDETAPPDFEALEKQLKKSVKGASLDTHRRWEAELTRMARALSTLSYAILALICISAIAMVIFATRTVLDANRQVVDVLHLVGAKDSYIARQIDRRFLKTGFMAGLLGVGLGVVTFFLLGLSGTIGAGGVADASRGLLFAPAGNCRVELRHSPERAHHRDSDLPGHLAHGAHSHVEKRVVIALRSLIFNIAFYVNLALFLVLGSEFFLTPRKWSVRALQVWARSSLWLLRVICGTHIEVRGRENIPDGACTGGGQASVRLGDLRHPSLSRRSLHGVEKGTVVDPVLRLVHLQVPHDRGGAQCRLCRLAQTFGPRRGGTGGRPADRHHAGRNQTGPRCSARLQARCRGPLRHARLRLPALCPEFRPVLAPPEIPALSRHHHSGIPAAHSAGLPRKAFQERLQNDIETATARLVAEGRESVRIKNKFSTSA